MPLDELTRRLEARRDQIRQLRRERLDIENATPNAVYLRDAIRRAQRDRDAVVSPEIEGLRARAADLIQELDKAWSSADFLRWSIYRVRETGVTATLSRYGREQLALLSEDLLEEAELRDRIRAELDRQGVFEFPVPEPLVVPALSAGGPDGSR